MKRITLITIVISLFLSCAHYEDASVFEGVRVAPDIAGLSISCMTNDQYGNLWLGSNAGLVRFDGSSYVLFTHNQNNLSSISSDIVRSVLCDSRGDLWVASQQGVDRYDFKTNSFRSVLLPDNYKYIREMYEDARGVVTVATTRAFFEYDTDRDAFVKKLNFNDMAQNAVYASTFRDSYGNLWVAGVRDLCLYDSDYGRLGIFSTGKPLVVRFEIDDKLFMQSGTDNVMFDMQLREFLPYPDGLRGIDWNKVSFCSRLDESSVLINEGDILYNYNSRSDKIAVEVRNSRVSASHMDEKGNIWLAMSQIGLRKIGVGERNNPDFHLFRFLESNHITSVEVDRDKFWMKAGGNDVVMYDRSSGDTRVIHLAEIIGDGDRTPGSIGYQDGDMLYISRGSTVYAIDCSGGNAVLAKTYLTDTPSLWVFPVVDKNGRLWVGGANASIYYSSLSDGGRVESLTLLPIDIGQKQIQAIRALRLKNGNIVFGFTDEGLVFVNPDTMECQNVPLLKDFRQLFITGMLEDFNGDIWVATSDRGLFIYERSVGAVRHVEDFGNDRIISLSKTSGNDIILTTNGTLYGYNRKTGSFDVYWKSVQENIVSDVRIVAVSGETIIVNDNGNYYRVFRGDVKEDLSQDWKMGLVLASGRKVIDIVNPVSIDVGRRQVIRLNYKFNNMDVVLTVPQLADGDVKYSYNFNRGGWSDKDNNPNIHLYGLKGGRNKLSIMFGSDVHGWESDAVTFIIKVPKPWWFSSIALILYSLVFFVVALEFFSLLKRLADKKQEAELANRQYKMQQQLNMRNMDFFANISHEFRTPLSIISGTVNQMYRDEYLPSHYVHSLGVMKRNTDRMARLVGNLLDFNKLEHDMLNLRVSVCDVAAITREIGDVMAFGAGQKDISFRLEGFETSMLVCLDKDKYETVVYNFLSNALKFTPPEGEIVLSGALSRDGDGKEWLSVSVTDNGIGIPRDKIDSIFDRFAQVASTSKTGGTGIGLYYSKALVNLHHGSIAVKNRSQDDPDATGCIFSFTIPVSPSAYTDAEKSAEEDRMVSVDRPAPKSEVATMPNFVASDTTILIIDDDYEIVYYLKSILSRHYNVITSLDPIKGYKMIESENPDVIISDVLMLEMDGLQLCRMVKENIELCHIPFILLTAKTTVEDQIKGLESGADAYVTKPFDPDYLLALVKTTLQNRESIRNMFAMSTSFNSNESKSDISGSDKALMEKLYKLMEEDLSSPDLNIKTISTMLGISRSKFYYKVKALTGMTPNEFFKQYKLNRSLELLKEGKYKIAAIADMVGFSSPSHFTTQFKKQFGKLPSQYF